ncbi:MAG: chemotaxis protein CheW [Gemmatimonadota bacterium]
MPSERFLDLYRAECRDCLRRLTGNALALERGEPGALEEAFRAAHTLKGMAAAMGHREVADTAHGVEDRLAELRESERGVDGVLIDELLQRADSMEAALAADAVAANGASPDPEMSGAENGPWTPSPPIVDGAGAVVSARLRPETPLPAARALALAGAARRTGDVLAVRPEQPGDGFDGILHVYFGSGDAAAALAAQWREDRDITAVHVGTGNGRPEGTPSLARKGSPGRTIRVDRERLDRLAEGIAELAVHFAMSDRGAAGNGRERASAVVAALQRTILELRTVPVGVVHDRAARVVRDAARAVGKEVDLEFGGGEIELDQVVLDAVTDPLMHILRNAVDHGIETADARESAGKGRRGRIRLEAERERTSVRITVSDDGGGVDADRVLAKAASLGIAATDSRDETLLRLMMQPGFTTATAVSDVSGRGVGLDAVGAQVRGLGGALDMTSVAGAGTTFTLRVPFTLAIVPGLRVRVANDEYAMPLTHVAEVASLGPDLVGRDGEREYVRVRGVPVPLVRLRRVLGEEASGDEPAAVVAELGERRIALAVDEVLEHEPIVVKSFDAPAGAPPIFTGATVRPDGRPVLLIDPMSVG